MLALTPNSGFTAELHYYYRPTSLTAGSDSGTTWLATNAPLAMLYGSLLEAYTFMKGEADVLQNYTIQFAESIGRLKNYGEALEDTDAYRTGLVRREKCIDLDLKVDESPIVNVVTTQNRVLPPKKLPTVAPKIMSVSENSPPAIRDQAIAFKRITGYCLHASYSQ